MFKDNRSISLPKGTDNLDTINNLRSLTLPRQYTNVLANRILKAIPLNPRQRSLIEESGCSENQILLQRVIKHANANKNKLCVVFLDLAKTSNIVSHHPIQAALQQY